MKTGYSFTKYTYKSKRGIATQVTLAKDGKWRFKPKKPLYISTLPGAMEYARKMMSWEDYFHCAIEGPRGGIYTVKGKYCRW